MLRSVLYTDNITFSAASFYLTQQQERGGDLLQATAPVGMVVHDVLKAIGLPENAISMILGSDMVRLGAPVEPTTYAPMKCCMCEDDAQHLIQSSHGPRAICDHCADQVQAMGFEIVL